jgi:two-component system, chemotaxis family, sensor kinase CheA
MNDTLDGFVADFTLDAQERCDRIEELLLAGPGCLDEIRRELHTLKGNAGMVGLRELQEAAHAMEEESDPDALLRSLDEFRKLLNRGDGGQGTGDRGEIRSVRVPFDALDELVDLLAEMVVFRNRLDDAIGRAARDEAWRDVAEAHDALGKTLSVLQDHIMAVRMVPLRVLFGQLRRIVHDEAAAAGKIAQLVAAGGETPMDKALLESAADALGHLVRNAVTHGIETPAQRAAAGKRAEGLVQISATTQSDEVWIDIRDDGAGIDAAAVAAAALRKGISFDALHDPLHLLFRSGFSTREDSDISSGRGVGLSAALEAVRRVGGDIDVDSAPGRGTRFSIRMPLTLSITRALLVRVDGDDYAVPLSAVVESLRVGAEAVHIVNDAAVFNWRGRVVPLLDLGIVMASAETLRRRPYVVVLEADGRNRGLLVDELIGMREIVVKGLGDVGANPTGIAGATILGDGRVLLILDPKSLIGLSPIILSPHPMTGMSACPPRRYVS